MKAATATGFIFKGFLPKIAPITVRTETTDEFTTLLLSDDDKLMLQVVVTPEIKRLLKDITK